MSPRSTATPSSPRACWSALAKERDGAAGDGAGRSTASATSRCSTASRRRRAGADRRRDGARALAVRRSVRKAASATWRRAPGRRAARGPDHREARAVRRGARRARARRSWQASSAPRRIQDILGDHQDAVVARERIRAGSRLRPSRFAAGRLIGLERAGWPARDAWPEAWRDSIERPGTQTLSGVVRAAGGVVVRAAAAGSRCCSSTAGLRRLVVSEGQVRAGRVRRGVRAPRGRGGDRPALRARAGSCPRRSTTTRRAARRPCATGRWRSSTARCSSTTRSTTRAG